MLVREQEEEEEEDPTPKPSSSQKFMLQPLSLQLELEELWVMLSECLDALADTGDPHAVLVLQPTVEAFFLVHADRSEEGKSAPKKHSRSRVSRLHSFHTISDTESNPTSPAPHLDHFSPMASTPGPGEGEGGGDPYAHLPPDTAKFIRFAGNCVCVCVCFKNAHIWKRSLHIHVHLYAQIAISLQPSSGYA